MNLVAFSIKTKGPHNFARRLWTVFTRFGFSEAQTSRALHSVVETLHQFDAVPTFFIPAVVLRRHPKLLAEIAQCGAEIGIHGYVHNDYRLLAKWKQFEQTQKAISVFQHSNIPYSGFRNPYLGWNRNSLEVYSDLDFHYESNLAILHDVVDLDTFSAILRSGYAKSLKLFQALPFSIYALRPQFEHGLLRIPTSIPDDEMLFDRLRITDPKQVGQIWSKVMKRVYDAGGLYTLNLHPERGLLCQQALKSLLLCAREQPLPVWITRIHEIAQWWKDRNHFRLNITEIGSQCWQVEGNCSANAIILARNCTIEGSQTKPWFGVDEQIERKSFVVKSATCPCIAISPQTTEEVQNFLHEQGYCVVRSRTKDKQNHAIYLDYPAGLGIKPEEQAEAKALLVAEIEALEKPLLRFACWPNGNRAALAISGDIDSVTVQDFFLRIVEVFQQAF